MEDEALKKNQVLTFSEAATGKNKTFYSKSIEKSFLAIVQKMSSAFEYDYKEENAFRAMDNMLLEIETTLQKNKK